MGVNVGELDAEVPGAFDLCAEFDLDFGQPPILKTLPPHLGQVP